MEDSITKPEWLGGLLESHDPERTPDRVTIDVWDATPPWTQDAIRSVVICVDGDVVGKPLSQEDGCVIVNWLQDALPAIEKTILDEVNRLDEEEFEKYVPAKNAAALQDAESSRKPHSSMETTHIICSVKVGEVEVQVRKRVGGERTDLDLLIGTEARSCQEWIDVEFLPDLIRAVYSALRLIRQNENVHAADKIDLQALRACLK